MVLQDQYWSCSSGVAGAIKNCTPLREVLKPQGPTPTKYGAPTPGGPRRFFREKWRSPTKTCGVPAPGGLRRLFPGKNDIPQQKHVEFLPRVASGGFFPEKKWPLANKCQCCSFFVTCRSILTPKPVRLCLGPANVPKVCEGCSISSLWEQSPDPADPADSADPSDQVSWTAGQTPLPLAPGARITAV